MWKRLRTWLRIAVTTVSLLVCGLLIVLWARSYWWEDFCWITLVSKYSLEFSSECGELYLGAMKYDPEWEQNGWQVSNAEFDTDAPFLIIVMPPGDHSIGLIARHWFLVSFFATLAALPWIKWRFSLRTLLIVLTPFALFFGAIAMSL